MCRAVGTAAWTTFTLRSAPKSINRFTIVYRIRKTGPRTLGVGKVLFTCSRRSDLVPIEIVTPSRCHFAACVREKKKGRGLSSSRFAKAAAWRKCWSIMLTASMTSSRCGDTRSRGESKSRSSASAAYLISRVITTLTTSLGSIHPEWVSPR